jgi:hypothetical protein
MYTTAEIITHVLRHDVNVGADTYPFDADLRLSALINLQELAEQVFTRAPHQRRRSNGTVVVTAGVGTMPADFASFGTNGRVFVQGMNGYELDWLPPDVLRGMRLANPSPTSLPTRYTIDGITAAGLLQIQVYPINASPITVELVQYNRRTPVLIDAPTAPGVEVGSATGLTGTFRYAVVFVHAAGKTEAAFLSDPLTLADQKGNLSQIATSPVRTVTAREVYRTTNGGFQPKLLTTLSDNVTEVFTGDNTVDGSLGADAPTRDQAVTGMEQFPESFHLPVLRRGLALMMQSRSNAGAAFEGKWDGQIRRLWAAERQDAHVPYVMPAYGSGNAGGRRRPRLLQ